jgi:hypothetical protein
MYLKIGIMALNGHVISGDVYAWSAVFILPINSALNPILYTVTAILGKSVITFFSLLYYFLQLVRFTLKAILYMINFDEDAKSQTCCRSVGFIFILFKYSMFVFLYRNQPENIYSFTLILLMRKPLLRMMSLDKMVVYYGDLCFMQLFQNNKTMIIKSTRPYGPISQFDHRFNACSTLK